MRRIVLGGLQAHVTGGSDGQGGGTGPLVILLHGFGASGTDLAPLSAEVPAPRAVRWLFPMAPIVLDPGVPEVAAPRAWWMIDMVELQVAAMTGQISALAERRPAGIDDAREKLISLLDAAEREFGVAQNQVVLGGFSQGAMLATDTVLRSTRPFAGLAILSGTLLARKEWQALAPARSGLPVLQSHGRADPILPFFLAEELRDLLTTSGLSVEWLPFSGGHGIPAPVLSRLQVLIDRLPT
jgi:phospholipase/carboxylesterase